MSYFHHFIGLKFGQFDTRHPSKCFDCSLWVGLFLMKRIDTNIGIGVGEDYLRCVFDTFVVNEKTDLSVWNNYVYLRR